LDTYKKIRENKMTLDELAEIEEQFYGEGNYDNYNLAEWARLYVPDLIKELRKSIEEINQLHEENAGIDI